MLEHPQMPGYRLNEYLAVIPLNDDLAARITAIKKKFSEQYQTAAPFGQKAHITLARFVTWNMMEDKIASKFRHIAMGTRPFKIELRGFGSYPSHSIYINITTKLPVMELNRQLRSAQRLMKAHPDHDPHFIGDPHINIANRLKPWQYERAWLEYSNAHFSAKAVADSMMLLKRPMGDRAYQIVERYDFMNMPVATTQGALFF